MAVRIFFQLDKYEQDELKAFIEDYYKKQETEKRSIKESFEKIQNKGSVGPVSSLNCPWCGK